MVELGFAMRDANGKIAISAEQLYFTINFDETCLSVDGSKGRRGGRPTTSCYMILACHILAREPTRTA